MPNTDPTFSSPATNPFGIPSGGFQFKPVFADIDGDGDLDLFIGKGDGNTTFYRNNGSNRLPAFATDGQGNLGLANVLGKASPDLVDIDGDGDLDAFIANRYGDTQFFRNTGSRTQAVFAAESGNFGLELTLAASTTLVFVDIDADGDQDAFIGDSVGLTSFFRNTGSASAPAFALQADNFGLPDVGFSASPTFADVDTDGDMDAFIGNRDGSTQFFRNTGTASAPVFGVASSNFGIGAVVSFAAPTLADIDADGDLDAFVGIGTGGNLQFSENTAPGVLLAHTSGKTAVTEGGATDTYTVVLNRAPTGNVTITLDNTNKQIWLSAASLTFTPTNWNIAQTVTVSALDDTVGEGAHAGTVLHTVGSADTAYDAMVVKPWVVAVADNDLRPLPKPAFAPVQANPFGLGNVGFYSQPAFADIDADGDLDAFVGGSSVDVKFFRNTGTANAPSFVVEAGHLGLSTGNGTYLSPRFADIDGDGDLDAFVGRGDGTTQFFRNTGSATAPGFANEPGNFGLPDVGESAGPAFADIDGDGDLDAFIGNRAGITLFLRNYGSVLAPRFAAEAGNFGLPDVGQSARLAFADMDTDGDLDAAIGNQDGGTAFFRNTGSAAAPAFASEPGSFGISDVGNYAAPALVDIDGDGDLDAFLGAQDGNFAFFLNPRGVQITLTGNNTVVAEGGSGDSYTVALTAAPTANVTITLSSTAQVSADAAVLTFTPTNWNLAQTILVNAVDDTVGEGPHAGALRHTVTSGDAAYNAMVVKPVTVRVNDNDLPLQDAAFGTPQLGAFGLVNVGGSAAPVFADIDADGDMDAFVGVSDGSTVFLRNVGTASAPSFVVEANNNHLGLGDPDHGNYAIPVLLDIDADGDLDAFVGFQDGMTRFFRNTGSASVPVFNRDAGALDLVAAGGYAQPTFADVDGDGDLDGLIGSESASPLQFYRNTGSASAPRFAAEPGALGIVTTDRFPSPHFVDLDGDGDQDLILSGDGSAIQATYRNVGTGTAPSFTLEGTDIGPPGIGQYTRPSFVDLDADGDLDAVAGNNAGDLAFYLNSGPGVQIRQSDGSTAVTEGGATDSYSVQLRSAPTANVTIALGTTNQQVSTSTSTLTFTPTNWNVPQTVTVAAVNDKVGEGLHKGVIAHVVSSADGNYQSMVVASLGVVVTDNDLPFAGPTFVAGDVNPFGISSQGGHSAPVLVDIDADGDMDAFVGNTGGTIRFFLNTGTVAVPNYALQNGSLGLVDVGDEANAAFADVDGDGDLDALVGSLQGTTRYFRNIGDANMASFIEEVDPIGIMDVGASSRPAFADIDSDGDFDLFVGNSVGEVWFHRNVGGIGAPLFQAAALATDNFGIGKVGAMASPTFTDLNGDGKLEAVVGDQDGQANYFINTGTAQAPTFVSIANGQIGLGDVGYASAPTFADIDGDGDLDALVGNLVGGTRLYLGDGTLALGPVADITIIDSARDDGFPPVSRTLNAVGADGAAVTYGIDGGTVNGATVSLGRSLGVLTVTRATGAASFVPNDAAIELLGAAASTDVVVTATDGSTTATRTLTIRVTQSGTTETAGGDSLGGAAGNDRFDGLAGNDTLSGGAGDDTLIGGPGNDTLEGDGGTDTADYSAAAGAVKAELWRAFALVDGDGGQDALRSIEVLVGSVHNDTLAGGDGSDRLIGGAGADGLYAGNGNDTLIGGAGNDTQDGGGGIDLVDYSAATGPVTAELWRSFALNDGQGGQDALWNIEALLGSAFNDILAGGNGNDSLSGAAGNDGLYAGNGNDTLIGGTGNDTLDGGANIDTADYSAATSAVTAELWRSFALNDGQGGQDALWNIERLIGSAFNDLLAGGGGNEFFSGGAGNDGIYAAAGIDTLVGGAGNDTLDGGPGIDVVDYSAAPAAVTAELWRAFALNDGQGGQDALWNIEGVIGSAFDDLMAGGANNEVLVGNAGNDGLYAAAGIDTLMGGAGNDTMDGGPGIDAVDYAGATGPVTAELWRAFASNDGQGGQDALWNIEYLLGSAFNDLLAGTDAANYLGGRNGADQLFGAGGNDTLDGGLGNDTLNGGAGLDSFLFNTALGTSNVDRVQDFVVVDDTVQLENAVFTALVSTGTLGAGLLRTGAGVSTAADGNDFILYNSSTGALFYDADGSGTGATPVQFALLGTGLGLTVADFVVI